MVRSSHSEEALPHGGESKLLQVHFPKSFTALALASDDHHVATVVIVPRGSTRHIGKSVSATLRDGDSE